MSDTSNNKRTTRLPLNGIITDPTLQMREILNEEAISDYTAAMKEGVAFPAVVVFKAANGRQWLADGFHRFKAARQAGLTEIEADVRLGERRDALLYAAGANSDHGLRRSQADKRKAVRAILDEPELSANKSNREIARLCNVSDFLVRSIRTEAGGAINRTPDDKDVEAPTSPAGRGVPPRSGRKSLTIKPPPDAGDAWEPPEENSADARLDREVRKAAEAGFDHLGKRLPDHLKDIFACSVYEDCVSSLLWMARHFNSDPCGFVRLHIKPTGKPFTQMIREFAQEAQSILEHHSPYSICPDCDGRENGCTSCFSTGWLSKGQWQEREYHGE